MPPTAALFAGMPSVSLTDMAALRLQTLSFFLAVFLLSAVAARWVWNGLRSDFPRLPRLSYPKAVGLVGLWGLLFLLVLTMISGARELMTPGAWKKDGLTYTLTEPPNLPASPSPPTGPAADARRAKLADLFDELLAYTAQHDGRFPPTADAKTTHASGVRYLYVPGRKLGDRAAVLAYEPDVFGDARYVLFADGHVTRLTTAELTPLLTPGGR